jgi:lactate dehydrogenase-like 2-hydroxyacid dehydrogenase
LPPSPLPPLLTQPQAISEHLPDVIVTKELPLDAPTVAGLPPCVRLVVEAGTGYNNIPLEACKGRGIAVANVPE